MLIFNDFSIKKNGIDEFYTKSKTPGYLDSGLVTKVPDPHAADLKGIAAMDRHRTVGIYLPT